MKLSIIIPVFNEAKTFHEILSRVEATEFPVEKELIIVDDYSTDGTRDILDGYKDKFVVLFHDKNYGKGHAVRTGIAAITGEFAVIQDADLEYDPADLVPMLKKMIDEDLSVLYGSRETGANRNRHSGTLFYFGGLAVTLAMNVLYNQRLTDGLTCYKMYRSALLKKFRLKSERFEIDSELFALTAKEGIRIKEFPISYKPRSVKEGKKITWVDGVRSIMILIKYRF